VTSVYCVRTLPCVCGTAVIDKCAEQIVYCEFDVHVSVHLGNVYVRLTVQLDVHVFICILYSSILFSSTCFGCYLHPSSEAQTAEYLTVLKV
jgi:hypothetical protein